MANLRLVSDWFSVDDLHLLTAIARKGDLLEIDKGLHQHWGVFMGLRNERGKKIAFVIHFSEPDEHFNPFQVVTPGAAKARRKTGVIKQRLTAAMSRHRVRINNTADDTQFPGSIHSILERAEGLIGTEHTTSTNKCEELATFCRYGPQSVLQQRQQQTEQAISTEGAVGLGVVVGGLLGMGLYAMFSDKKPDQNRKRRPKR